ncbi:FAD-dependent monooxygenase OpS4, partial [Pseudocercospora fuligena]
MPFHSIAIIGAGLTGLSLSIALQRQGIKPKIYETRPEHGSNTPGAVMLSPNGLRSLDHLGIYPRIKSKSYSFSYGYFRSNDHKIVGEYEMGNAERYGYDAMRIHRKVLLDELRDMAQEAGVEILYGKKLVRVLNEDSSGVIFICSDNSEHKTDLLIGADGIHSTVRRHLHPDVKTVFSNIISIITPIPTSAVKFPFEPYDLPSSIHLETCGSFILAPQGAQGEELLLAIQQVTHERDGRAGWDALLNDKEYLYSLMRKNYEKWNSSVQDALDAVDLEKIFVWPFYSVPKLESWRSEAGKVVMLGDAAHAIPPAAGQGINQGFEDVESLALLVAAANEKNVPWDECLEWWQQYRQKRIDHVTWLTIEMNRRRMPGWNGTDVEPIDNSELFGVQIPNDVQRWLESR